MEHMAIRITCIRKDSGNHENPYVAISSLGWVEETTGEQKSSTRQQMYDWVATGGYAYVQAGNAKAKLIGAVSPRGNKYVKTEADSTQSDNLLKLSECR
jgi:hypothetical protein